MWLCLLDQVASCSFEYIREWAEAVYFGLASCPIDVSCTVAQYILLGLESSMSCGDVTIADAAPPATEEGFSAQSKLLLLAGLRPPVPWGLLNPRIHVLNPTSGSFESTSEYLD